MLVFCTIYMIWNCSTYDAIDQVKKPTLEFYYGVLCLKSYKTMKVYV